MMEDIFRPKSEPARTIYDALIAEATKRDERDVAEWIAEERKAVWRAAMEWCQMHGIAPPALADVAHAERLACGHCDYGSKGAHGIVELIRTRNDMGTHEWVMFTDEAAAKAKEE